MFNFKARKSWKRCTRPISTVLRAECFDRYLPLQIQCVFFPGPPKKCFDWPPLKLSKCWNHIHFDRHLGVFRSEGGPVWDSNVFLKSVTYRPTLSKFRRGAVKKNTLYLSCCIEKSNNPDLHCHRTCEERRSRERMNKCTMSDCL